jgi:hypothetical protein
MRFSGEEMRLETMDCILEHGKQETLFLPQGSLPQNLELRGSQHVRFKHFILLLG